MKSITLAIVAVLVFAAVAVAQIPDAVQRQAGRVCLIRVAEGGGSQSCGSGVIVSPHVVMTCWHLFRDSAPRRGRECSISYPGGTLRGELNAWHSGHDVAVVYLPQPVRVEPLEYAEVPMGQPVYGAGHAGASPQATWIVGRAAGRYRQAWSAAGTPARQGQSGGPCFDEAGRLVGIVSASDMRSETIYAPLDEVAAIGYLPERSIVSEAVFRRSPAGRYILPWNARANAQVASAGGGVGQQCQPGGDCWTVPQPRPTTPNQPPIAAPPVTPPAVGSGPPGPAGPQGPAGPAGPPGSDATITDEHLDRIASIVFDRMRANPEPFRGPAGPAGSPPSIESIVERLPPITIAVENYDGSTATATKRLGEPFTIRFHKHETQRQNVAQPADASIR